jgi:ribosomal protein L39E
MMALVNEHCGAAPLRRRKLHKRIIESLGNMFLAVLSIPDWIRMKTRHATELRMLSSEQDDIRKDRLDTKMHDTNEPWDMRTAFYAISGTCVYRSIHTTGRTMVTLDLEMLEYLASNEPDTLLPLESTQNSGQASGIVKLVTCIQAAWFCSQCIARMSTGMAISLLELNTFAHCVSAFFIYGFWWYKPYDVTSHTFIQSEMLDFLFLRHAAVKASQGSGYIKPAILVSIYADKSVGVKVRLAKIMMEEVQSNQEEDARSLKITSRDVIPGTGFAFQKLRLPYVGSCLFFLPKQSLIYWQRLWYFVAKTSFAMELVDDLVPDLQSGSRSKNFRGDLADVTASIVLPLDWSTTSLSWGDIKRITPSNIAFVLYGGLHLFAWKHSFRSTTETILWKIAGVLTASSGITAFLLVCIANRSMEARPATNKLLHGL